MDFRLSMATFVAASLLLSTPSVIRGDSFTLGKYIPADVHFYGNWISTKEGDRLVEPYFEAMERLIDSGIAKDVFDLVTIELSENARAEALAIAKRVLEILGTPDWEKLVEKEVVFAFKIAMPFPEYAVVFKAAEGTAAERRAELRKLLQGFAGFAPGELVVSDASRKGAEISSLQLGDAPFAISVASKRDVVMLTTSDTLLDSVLGLMDSEGGEHSIVKNERFKAALAGLPPATDGQFYFDLAGYMGFFRGLLQMAKSEAGGDAHAEGLLAIIGTVLDEVTLLETVAGVDRTEGDRMFSDVRLSFKQRDDGPGFFEKLVRDQRPLENAVRVVPEDALHFYMTSGIDVLKIYDAVTGLIEERMPDGREYLATWEGIQAHVGFHLRRDLLSWIDGGFGWVCLPRRPAGTGTESVFFVRVRDNEKAREVVTGVLRRVKRFLENRGQSIEYVELPGMEGFREIRIASLPFLRPVIGLPEGILVVARSREAIARVAATFRGEAPNILENPRFRALGRADGHIAEVAYQNLDGALEGPANLLGCAGFVASILPKDRETKPILKLGAILTKLSAFLRDIDIGRDYATWTRYDAEHHALVTRQMTRVRAGAGERSAKPKDF